MKPSEIFAEVAARISRKRMPAEYYSQFFDDGTTLWLRKHHRHPKLSNCETTLIIRAICEAAIDPEIIPLMDEGRDKSTMGCRGAIDDLQDGFNSKQYGFSLTEEEVWAIFFGCGKVIEKGANDPRKLEFDCRLLALTAISLISHTGLDLFGDAKSLDFLHSRMPDYGSGREIVSITAGHFGSLVSQEVSCVLGVYFEPWKIGEYLGRNVGVDLELTDDEEMIIHGVKIYKTRRQ